MKAAQISAFGGPEVIAINNNATKPSLKQGQVLVMVHAASINPFDGKLRSGVVTPKIEFPMTLGGDLAGVVGEVGAGVSEYKVGDEIYGTALVLSGGSGAFAEFASVNITHSARKPKSVDFIQAAALPLVGSSTIQALEEHTKLQSGQKILIHGGAGGIGHLAIQLAKTLGAYVATTVSTDDVAFVKELGADEIIDYKKEAFEDKIKDFDAVFVTAGAQNIEKSFGILKKGGVLVSMLGQPDEELAKQYGISAIGQGTHTNTVHLTRLTELVEKEKITVSVDKVFPLEQIKEAFVYQEEVRPRGKVVIEIKT